MATWMKDDSGPTQARRSVDQDVELAVPDAGFPPSLRIAIDKLVRAVDDETRLLGDDQGPELHADRKTLHADQRIRRRHEGWVDPRAE